MVNMISKAPKDRQSEKFSYNVGDYGTQRVTLEATGPVPVDALGKTSYIVTLSQYQRDFGQEYARNRNLEYYAALKHKFDNGGNLLLSAEYLLQIRHSPNSASPLINDQKGTPTNTDDEIVGYAKGLAGYNAFGPVSELTRGATSYTANYDRRLNDVFSVRASGNYYLARRWDYNQNNGWPTVNINPAPAAATGLVPPITVVRGAVPSKGQIVEDGGGIQSDIQPQDRAPHPRRRRLQRLLPLGPGPQLRRRHRSRPRRLERGRPDHHARPEDPHPHQPDQLLHQDLRRLQGHLHPHP
jgi:hypothetical protein